MSDLSHLPPPELISVDGMRHERFDCLSPVIWREGALIVLDQLALPSQLRAYVVTSWREAAWSIKTMAVRGAPAIGITAAYGLALAARSFGEAHAGAQLTEAMEGAASVMGAARPTAVNLMWAIERMRPLWRESSAGPELFERLLEEALCIHQEDIEMCRAMGRWGATLMGPKTRALTHCNTGALATGGHGTALGVMREGWAQGRLEMVYADETRPYLQGARLTMWELMRDGVPCTLQSDSMAAYMMQQGLIDSVWVGADRITARGDTANKIGTYGLALLAQAHKLPFYVVAPTSTVDLTLLEGEQIPIEQRPPRELTYCGPTQLAPEGASVVNPAFDVTPHQLITAIITEVGVVERGEEGSFQADLTAHVTGSL